MIQQKRSRLCKVLINALTGQVRTSSDLWGSPTCQVFAEHHERVSSEAVLVSPAGEVNILPVESS